MKPIKKTNVEAAARYVAERLEPEPVAAKMGQRWSNLGFWEWTPDPNGQRSSDWMWVLAPVDWRFAGAVIEGLDGQREFYIDIEVTFVRFEVEVFDDRGEERLGHGSSSSGPDAIVLAAARALGWEED